MEGLGSDLPDLRNRKSAAKLARELHDVEKSGKWRQKGFQSLPEWFRKTCGYSRHRTFDFLLVAKELLPRLSDEHIDELGITLARDLARLAKKRMLTDELVERAAKDGPKEFKKYVERMLGRGYGGAPKFGEPLEPSFRSLAYAPTSEQGVVYVFGMVSHDMGFRVEGVGREYPDCRAKRKVKFPGNKERWQDVRIEFEYRSGDFDHPPEQADLIVCWEDDFEKRHGRKAPLEVLELKSAIDRLRQDGKG